MGVEFRLTKEVPARKPTVAVLHLGGWLDAQGEPGLVEAVQKAGDEGSECVVLDLKDVSTLTSAGIRGIQKSFNIMRSRGGTVTGRLKLCNAAPQIYEVLSMTGVLISVPTYESVDIAVDSCEA
jgi:anti-anti-sigma factor